jgi:hypothetical protein
MQSWEDRFQNRLWSASFAFDRNLLQFKGFPTQQPSSQAALMSVALNLMPSAWSGANFITGLENGIKSSKLLKIIQNQSASESSFRNLHDVGSSRIILVFLFNLRTFKKLLN